MTMAEQMTRATLLERMHSARAELEAVLHDASEERFSRPGVSGDWSIRDLLAHISFWERRTVDRLHKPSDQQPAPMTEATMHALNAEAAAAGSAQPLAAVVAGSDASYQLLLREIEGLSDETLNETERLGPDSGPVWDNIAGNGYDHYAEHAAEIRAWLAALPA
jgi:uncharacterized damage-inducible protein DinB